MGVFVPASFGGIKFSAESIAGQRARRITEHQAYGRSGADTEDTGRNAYRDTINARLDIEIYKRLLTVVNVGKVRTFTHPVLGNYKARMHIVTDSMGATRTANSIMFVAEVIEDVEQPLSTVATQTPRTYKKQAESWYDEAVENWPAELSEVPAYAEIVTAFGSAFTDFTTEADLLLAGAGSADALARVASGVETAVGDVLTVLHGQSEYVEGSYAVATSAYNLVGAVQDMVDVVASTAEAHTARVLDSPIDVYTLALNLYGETTQAAEIIERNRLIDPFWIPAGSEITLPFADTGS